MNLTLSLAKAAILMVLFMIPGFLLRKSGIADENIAHVLSQLLVYVAQPALLFGSFLREYSSSLMKDFLLLGAVSLAIILIVFFCSDYMFPRSIRPERRKVLRFGTVFFNAGNMGIPLVIYTLGSGYVFYLQSAILVFNLVVYTLGRYLYSEDKKNLSLHDAIFNPGMLPLLSGFIFFVTGMAGWIVNNSGQDGALGYALTLFTGMVDGLSDMVAPLTMIIIGIRLADTDFKGVIADGWMYLMLFYRLLLVPTVTAGIAIALRYFGLLAPEVCAVIVIAFSTPCAALTTVLAELYGGDSVYGSRLVAVSTLISVATMPVVISLL